MNKIKVIKAVIVMALFIVLIPKINYATVGVNLEDAATLISESELQKVDLDFKNLILDGAFEMSFFEQNVDGTYSAKLPYAGTDMVYMAPGTYSITAKNAFIINNQPLDFRITIYFDHDNVQNGQLIKYKVIKESNENAKLYLYGYNLDANITYEVLNSAGQYVDIDFCYGIRDPDGADYLWNGVATSNIYYNPGVKNEGNYEFGKAFKVDNEGIKIQSHDLEFSDVGVIFIGNNTGSSHFTYTWSTSRDSRFNDMLILPDLYYEPHKVNIKINMNEGSLAESHGSMVGTNGELVTMYGSDIIHKIPFGGSLTENGLSDWNNQNYINVERTGYYAKTNEEYNTSRDGTGTSYNQEIGYAATDFSTNQSTDATITLYVNWVLANYNISYTLNGGSHGEFHPTTATYNSVVRVSNPTRKGYIFTGWTMTNGNTSTALYGTSESNVATAWSEPTSSKVKSEYFKNLTGTNGTTVTLNANWEAKKYKVIYEGNGGTWDNTDTWYDMATFGSGYTVQNNFYTKPGYSFTGWATENGYTGWTGWSGTWVYDNGEYGIKDGELVLYAQWAPISYTVTYKSNGAGGNDVVDTVVFGTAYTVRGYNLFTNGGNYIVEWNENSAGGGASWTIENTNNWIWDYTRNVVLYAIWSNVFTVEYRGNGGTWNNTSSWSNTVTYGNTYTVENNFYTYPGHQFICWKDPTGVTWDEGWTGEWKYNNGQYGIDHGKLVLVAQWTGNTVTVTIKLDNENWSNSQMKVALYRNGTEKYVYEDAVKNGATVTWNGVESGTYDIYAFDMLSPSAILIDSGVDLVVTTAGNATIDYYTLTLNKGTGISEVEYSGRYLKNQPVSIDATVADGYTWEGWSVISGDSPN